jgi:hypothetical protein
VFTRTHFCPKGLICDYPVGSGDYGWNGYAYYTQEDVTYMILSSLACEDSENESANGSKKRQSD